MSVSMVIEIEGDDEPNSLTAQAYEVPKVIETLDLIAQLQGRPALSQFFKNDNNDLEELIVEFGTSYIIPEKQTWHDPAEALDVIQSLISHLKNYPERVMGYWSNEIHIQERRIVSELEKFEECLDNLISSQLRFQFNIH